jgi:V/A-type H+-transporting ATPase subunit G/H
MGDSLKELLDAETEAEAIVASGEKARDAIVQKALDDAAEMEKQFQQRLPELHQSFLDKAQERAVQSIAEIKLRYDEHNKELRRLASKHEKEALDLSIALVLDSSQEIP